MHIKKGHERTVLFLLILASLICSTLIGAEAIDISDTAVEKSLAFPFQYDFTKIKDDFTLREFIDALDNQLAMIDYRRRVELVLSGVDVPLNRRFSPELDERYIELFGDGYMFSLLEAWANKSQDRVNKAFIRIILSQRDEFLLEPGEIIEIDQLTQRISDRLFSFQFKIGDNYYRASEAARIIEQADDPTLSRQLFEQQNDSAAVVAKDAARLYYLYSRLGERFGYRASFDRNLAPMGFRKPEWIKIGEELKKATEDELNVCLAEIRQDRNTEDPKLYEVELLLRDSAILADSLFPADKCEKAVAALMAGLGLAGIREKANVYEIARGPQPALAVKLYPPYENAFFDSREGGFDYYRRLAMETGRLIMWAQADSTLPFLLREYPIGTEEVLTGLAEDLALDSVFLADFFGIDAIDLNRFLKYDRWLRVLRIRQLLLYFFFDYYLSEGRESDPVSLYWRLEESIMGSPDSSYHWIETLLSGSLKRYPVWLGHLFSRIKLQETLYREYGENWSGDTRSGQFLIESLCRPGRSQSLEEFISAHSQDKLSVADIKRQFRLR